MRNLLVMAAAVVILAACTSEAEGPDGDPPEEKAAVCDPELAEALSRWADAGYSGSIAITSGGEFGCRAAFGMADAEAGVANMPETVFAIGSVSKAFTAAAVFDLVDAGALALGDRAGDLLPGLGGPAAEATVEQLLLHTGGLAGAHGTDHEPLGREEAVTALGALETAFEPGTDYRYSNAGYSLLALLVDELSESSYREYLAERILTVGDGRVGGFWDGEPAAPGPRAAGYEDGERAASDGGFDGPHWALDGNGGLAMSAVDLAAWTAALFGGEVVAPEAVEALTATGFDHGDGSTEVPGWIRFGRQRYGVPVYMASGGGGGTGHHAVSAWLPESDRSVAVTSNTDEITAAELLEAVGPALAAGEPVPVPEGQDVEVDAAELERLAGPYSLESGGTLTVAAEAGRLVVAADGADAVAAMSEPGGGFSAEEVERHEEAVLALLRGESEAGSAEREAVESELGAIEGLDPVGTVVEDFELRTYVHVQGADGTRLAWYALDEHGGLAAAWLEAEPPEFSLVPVGDDEYRQGNLSGAGLGLRVRFEGDLMVVTGSEGTVEARRTT
ncbi:serine hydrolase domain-containing protein [Glycomyces xiaoerkulensis]|uniref:serine hydrolase domain-containing protein n=1 Tax=Glycomyces xiaoerkulensis TaxID=2038139 RepID=UPI000C256069|nr:serine hydrolase domain-containing protein [Glycomyces xiaoerkulensis]